MHGVKKLGERMFCRGNYIQSSTLITAPAIRIKCEVYPQVDGHAQLEKAEIYNEGGRLGEDL